MRPSGDFFLVVKEVTVRKVVGLFAALLIGSSVLYAVSADALVLTGENAGFMLRGRPVQFEYVHCLLDPSAMWFEDGSAICGGVDE